MGETGTPVKIRPENEMSEYSAKTLREKAKARARALARPGDYAKDQEVSSADWSPAPQLDTDVKTGARPVGKGARLYNKGGKVVGKATGGATKARADRKARKSGGRTVEKEIGIGMANKDVRAANEQREGKKHIGAFKKGGKAKKNLGGVLEKISPAYAAMRSIQRGPDEEQQTKDRLQQAAMMNAARGAKKGGKIARKSGGNIPTEEQTLSTKKIIGSNPIKPVRGKAENYEKGGRTKKQDGGSKGSFLERMVGKPKTGSDMSQVGKMGSARYPTEEKETVKEIISPRDTTKETVETMERLGEAGRKKGGRTGRDDGGSVKIPKTTHKFDSDGKIIPPTRYDIYNIKNGKIVGKAKSRTGSSRAVDRRDNDYGAYAHRAVPVYDDAPSSDDDRAERKSGGRTRAKGKTNINIVIAAGRKAGPETPAPDMAAGMPSAPANIPVPMPPAGPGAGAPPPAAMPMGGPPGAPMPGIPGGPMGRKAGGRITKIAKSYKDMEAGAVSGEGRLQKTDIAKLHKDAPARKRGGKVYRSYKDLDAGAGSGPGRQEKTEIETYQRARGK